MSKLTAKNVVVMILFLSAIFMVSWQFLKPHFNHPKPRRVVPPQAGATAAPVVRKEPSSKSLVRQVMDVAARAVGPHPTTAPAMVQPSSKLGTNGPSAIVVPMVLKRLPDWLGLTRDPFQARYVDIVKQAVIPVPAAQLLRLNGIWRQTGCRLAVINKSFVKEGEEMLGFKILKIEEDLVTVSGTGGVEDLPLRMAPGGGKPKPNPSATNQPPTQIAGEAAAPATNAPAPADAVAVTNQVPTPVEAAPTPSLPTPPATPGGSNAP